MLDNCGYQDEEWGLRLPGDAPSATSEPPLRMGWGLPVPLFQLAISFVSAQLQ